MKEEMIKEKIFTLLQESDLNWHSGYWWDYKDEWFKQFTPEEIDAVALEMAIIDETIETNGRGGFRRKEKSPKEKRMLYFTWKKGDIVMRKVSELNYKEWDKLVRSLTDNKKKAKKLCKKMRVDFRDVKAYDWGFDWQY